MFNSNIIPRRIVQYWNTKNIPDDIQVLMKTWREKNPEFEYILFDRDSAIVFLDENYDKEITALFKSANLPAMQSDIFRVAYCLRMGGVYVDAATTCIKSIDKMLDVESELILMRKWNDHVWNGFIACRANSMVLKRIFDTIIENMKNKNIQNIWLATGPGIFTALIDSMNEREKSVIKIYEQVKEAKQYFDLVNDLEHKKDKHWSKMQKNITIYGE